MKVNKLFITFEVLIILLIADIFSFNVYAVTNEKNKISQVLQNGTYVISSALDSNMVLDITNNSTKEGANVEIWRKNNQNNQKFNVTYIGDGYYTFEAANSGKVISANSANAKNEDNVIQSKGDNKDLQKWLLKDAGNGYYYIICKDNSLYLDVYNNLSVAGTNVQLYKFTNGKNQKFKFNKVNVISGTKTIGDGTYTISSGMDFNEVIDVAWRI